MRFEFEVEARPSYVHVLCRGGSGFESGKESYRESDLKTAEKLFRVIFAAAEEHYLSRVLIDVRPIMRNLSTTERYAYGELIAEQWLEHAGSRGIRIGLVGKEPLIDPERFGETVASNRGCAIKVGTDMKEILDWLGIEPADRPDADNGN